MKTKSIAVLIGIFIAAAAFSASFAVEGNECGKDYFKAENMEGIDATGRVSACFDDKVILDVRQEKVMQADMIGAEEPANISCEQTMKNWKAGVETKSIFCEKNKQWYNVTYEATPTRESTKMRATFLIFLAAVVVSAILTIVNKLLVNQERIKEIQKYVSSYNKKLIKATREKNQDELKALEPEKQKVMQMQSEMMKMQMPVFAALLPFFVVFFLLGKIAGDGMWGEFVNLPFAIPLLGLANAKLGWLGWYILCSIPMTSVFRRALGVH